MSVNKDETPETKLPLKDAFARENAQPSILIYDIERISGRARVWDPRTRYVPISSFVSYAQTICMASKWYGKNRVMFHAVWESDDPDYLANETWKLFDACDIAISYNGIRFDEPHLRELWLTANKGKGLPPPRPWKSVDLYRVNRSQFGFESKSLRHLCERLGVLNKDGHYDAEQAERAVAGDAKAQRALAKYNRGDVLATEAVYERLRPYVRGLNLNLHYGMDEQTRCPSCGKTDTLEPAGWAATALTKYAAYRCSIERGGCGSLARNASRKHSVTMRGV